MPLKKIRHTKEWRQSEMSSILDPLLEDPRDAALNNIVLSTSERDAILMRGFNVRPLVATAIFTMLNDTRSSW